MPEQLSRRQVELILRRTTELERKQGLSQDALRQAPAGDGVHKLSFAAIAASCAEGGA